MFAGTWASRVEVTCKEVRERAFAIDEYGDRLVCETRSRFTVMTTILRVKGLAPLQGARNDGERDGGCFLGLLGSTVHKVGAGRDIGDVSVALHRTVGGNVR